MTTGDVVLRPAAPGEETVLSDLAFRSKAHWGYDTAFLERVRLALEITDADVAEGGVVVAEQAGAGVVGFYRLAPAGDRAELGHLFVDPPHIGTGLGARLYRHALDAARALGCRTVWLEADPNAEGFYRRLGAVTVDEVETLPGRRLPIMTTDLGT